jgi:hypothetical protein
VVKNPIIIFLFAFFASVIFISCSDDNGGSSSSDKILRETFYVESVTTPVNPVSGASTPVDYNKVIVHRYRYNTSPPKMAKAILINLPGMGLGANVFHYLARQVVLESDGLIEVWNLDRRSNLLEDTRGLEAAERSGNPDTAYSYYFEAGSVANSTYAGSLNSADYSYVAEWGLPTMMADIMAVIDTIPVVTPEQRRSRIYLAGHGIGANLAMAFAGWDFDGDPSTLEDAGYNQIGGVILLDGGGYFGTPITEQQYLQGIVTSGLPGLEDMRSGDASVFYRGSLPTIESLMALEIAGLFAHFRPLTESTMVAKSVELQQLLSLNETPLANFRATNLAVLGLAFDDNYQSQRSLRVAAGLVKGPTEQWVCAEELCGEELTLEKPLGSAEVYGWLNGDELGDTSEVTALSTLAEATFTGEGNFAEWYFPARLYLDILTLGDYSVEPSGDWRTNYGINLFHTSRVDSYVLAIGASDGYLQQNDYFYNWRDVIAPAYGSSLERGFLGFDTGICTGYNHLDILFADNESVENCLFSRLSSWIYSMSGSEDFGIVYQVNR